jgi:hypothetical protein
MLRETKAKWKKRVPFLGVEGGVLPLIIAGLITLLCTFGASRQRAILPYVVGLAPVVCTWTYMLIFLTGRRPHFTRDTLFMLFPNAKAQSPNKPQYQPIHPTGKDNPRCVRTKIR